MYDGVNDYINADKPGPYAEYCIFYVAELLNSLFYILQINTVFSTPKGIKQKHLTQRHKKPVQNGIGFGNGSLP